MKPVWQRCLSDALTSLQRGSLGIAAAIVDSSGAIVSSGTNQLYETFDSSNTLKGTPLSHAEVNAILGMPEDRRWDRTLTLYTTVEPCPMCIGAIAMAGIRNVQVGSRDPWAGSLKMIKNHEYWTSKSFDIQFIEDQPTEHTFTVLHFLSVLRFSRCAPDHPVFTSFRSHNEAEFHLAESLASSDRFWETLGKDSEHDGWRSTLSLIGTDEEKSRNAHTD